MLAPTAWKPLYGPVWNQIFVKFRSSMRNVGCRYRKSGIVGSADRGRKSPSIRRSIHRTIPFWGNKLGNCSTWVE